MNLTRFFLIACFALLILSCENVQNPTDIEAGRAIQVDSMPAYCPYFATDGKGKIILSWARSVNDSTFSFCYAVSGDNGDSFGKTMSVPGSENIQPHSENLPKMIRKPGGELIALWGVGNPHSKNKYSGRIYYCQSLDDGNTWSRPVPLVSDSAGYDQRYYDVALLPGGEVAIIWLDNRKTTSEEGSALYFAVTEGNAGFKNERIIAEGCCQCCRTDLLIGKNGDIHVLYRGIIQDSIRDMLYTVSTDRGVNFAKPQLISKDNWVLKGCPHTGPSMTENKQGIHFAWFTGGANQGCHYTQSADNGKSFAPADRISFSGSHPQIASFPNGELVVTWDEPVRVNNKLNKKIAVQKRSASGTIKKESFITMDTLTASYPVVACLDDGACAIAYIVKRWDKNYIMYQRVNLQ